MAREKRMTWNVRVPDTYAESRIDSIATKLGSAAHKTAQNKIDKYSKLANIHILLPIRLIITSYRPGSCDTICPADGISTLGGSTSVRGRFCSPHMAKLQAASVPIA